MNRNKFFIKPAFCFITIATLIASLRKPRATVALANSYNTPVIDREGEGRYYSDTASVTAPWLLYKRGSDENHVAICAAADEPFGVSPDRPKLAEDQLSIWYLGNHEGSMFGTASGAIAAGDTLVPADGGKVRTLPAGAGTYYVIGKALTAAVDGQQVSFVHRLPYPPTVQ